jgi:hypothetical protein
VTAGKEQAIPASMPKGQNGKQKGYKWNVFAIPVYSDSRKVWCTARNMMSQSFYFRVLHVRAALSAYTFEGLQETGMCQSPIFDTLLPLGFCIVQGCVW